ncbi:MAG: C_GCAxxG_C_C family protein [Candidatus Korarchaeota archaeon]|nr:C_GCAxxG_C_C family protein [Candidatus Korarchaeota archaeon]NIU85308.1 hypothetical protein [Candidatus Thorarchaeota archaeon]NIW15408.1 hypothetical protein [Candidatus Thorarchaeota archaeon]NIW53352.1 hypothetical protein [Candidatus Korarchaeota archaeon]
MTEDQDIMQNAYEKGKEYEARATDCCQSAIAAIQEAIGCTDDNILRAGSPFAGGLGFCHQGTCGALVGATMVIGQLYGRTREEFDEDAKRKINDPDFDYVKATKGWNLAYELFERFIIEYGSCICKDVSEAVLGPGIKGSDFVRPGSPAYKILQEKLREVRDINSHAMEGCATVVGNAAKWATEIILREGIPDRGK